MSDEDTSGLDVAVPEIPDEVHQEFSLTPARSVRGIIDYTRSAGRKIYERATSKLEEDLFDCNSEDLYSFLKALKDRSREFGWDEHGIGVLSIPDDPVNPQEFKSLIDYHGEISMETIRAFEATYINGQSRAAQDTAQLYRCLMTSMSKEGKRKILVWENMYTIDGLGSGNLLLKTIIRESHLDTNATSSSIRTKLTDLDRYLPTIGQDITKFNTYVKLLVDGLRSRGEVTQDLLVNLFKGYLACSDNEFVEYIKRKQDKYEEGEDLEPDLLMKNAADKYKTLLQKGQWNVPSASETKILALQSQVKKLKKERDGNKKQKAKRTKGKEKPDWFDKRPRKSELNQPKKWNGKQWYYCHPDTGGKCDGKHRLHHPSECQGTKYRFDKNNKKNNDSTPKKRDGGESSGNKQKKQSLKLRETLKAEAATIVSKDDEKSDQSSNSSDSE